jgi:hypothetical protein
MTRNSIPIQKQVIENIRRLQNGKKASEQK